MPLNMQPLSDKFGVAITNVDLSKDIDQNLFNEIVDVFVKKQVLVFRNQRIEPQHQLAFSRRFGPLEMSLEGQVFYYRVSHCGRTRKGVAT
jgi:alpha-ketoglutarate-dependent taurine dioxygenase